MTTEGQGSAANPVGLGIPVVIEGPWAEPRIYPEWPACWKIPMRPMQSSGRWARACSAKAARHRPTSRRQARRNLGQPAAAGIGQPQHDPGAPAPSSPQDQLKPPPPDQESPMDSIMKQLFGVRGIVSRTRCGILHAAPQGLRHSASKTRVNALWRCVHEPLGSSATLLISMI